MTSNDNITTMTDTLTSQLDNISTTEDGEHFIGIENGAAQLTIRPLWNIEDGAGMVNIEKSTSNRANTWWIEISTTEALAVIEALSNSLRQIAVVPNLNELVPDQATDEEVTENIRILTAAMEKSSTETVGELMEYCREHGTTPAQLAQQ